MSSSDSGAQLDKLPWAYSDNVVKDPIKWLQQYFNPIHLDPLSKQFYPGGGCGRGGGVLC